MIFAETRDTIQTRIKEIRIFVCVLVVGHSAEFCTAPIFYLLCIPDLVKVKLYKVWARIWKQITAFITPKAYNINIYFTGILTSLT
jgi:hypothetical protein